MEDVRRFPVGEDNEVRVSLDDLSREGALRMIAAALEVGVDQYVDRFAGEVDERGHRLVVRNSRARERKVTSVRARFRAERRGPTTSVPTRRPGSGSGSAHGSCRPMRGGRRRLVR